MADNFVGSIQLAGHQIKLQCLPNLSWKPNIQPGRHKTLLWDFLHKTGCKQTNKNKQEQADKRHKEDRAQRSGGEYVDVFRVRLFAVYRSFSPIMSLPISRKMSVFATKAHCPQSQIHCDDWCCLTFWRTILRYSYCTGPAFGNFLMQMCEQPQEEMASMFKVLCFYIPANAFSGSSACKWWKWWKRWKPTKFFKSQQ